MLKPLVPKFRLDLSGTIQKISPKKKQVPAKLKPIEDVHPTWHTPEFAKTTLHMGVKQHQLEELGA